MRPKPAALLLDALLIAGSIAIVYSFGVALISGGSMEPALAPGDLAVYSRLPGPAEAGSMVVMGARGRRYVHRIVSVSPSGTIVTRGDANPIPDRDETSTDAIGGRVVAVVRSGRLLRGFASSIP